MAKKAAPYPFFLEAAGADELEHHDSLRAELPSLRSIRLFDAGETTWQNIPADSEGFEEEALHLAELVLKKDPRLGKVPKARKKSLTKKKKAAKKKR